VSPAWSLLTELSPKGLVQDGKLARAYAAKLCSDVNAAPLREQRPGSWSHLIHCRKLRGETSAKLEAELSQACANATGLLEEFCWRNSKTFKKMVRTALPFTLSASDAPAPTSCLLRPVDPE